MAWYGVKPAVLGLGWPRLGVYWGIFLLSLLVTFYMVLLDFRYIRVLYAQGEKELYEETLGSEDFRRALLKRDDKGGHSPDGPEAS